MTIKIPADVARVLSAATVEPRAVILNGQLDRKLYTDVNKVLVALGGKWSRSDKAHIFPDDPADRIEQAVLTGEYTNEKADFDAFYTPPEVAAQVADLADLSEDQKVLEPSSGAGALVVAAADRTQGLFVTTYEVRGQTRVPDWWEDVADTILNLNFGTDFLTVDPDPVFDRVIMNPPFSGQQDMAHVTHALRFVKPGGRLVAIMSPAFTFRVSAQGRDFRKLLDRYDHEVHPLPEGSFKSSGTGVNAVILVVDVP